MFYWDNIRRMNDMSKSFANQKVSLLSDKIMTELRMVAMDKALQRCVVEAMFRGCERSTDLWEDLEVDAPKFSKQTQLLLWGRENPFSSVEEREDYHESADLPCLYNVGDPHLVIEYLLDRVQENVMAKLT